MLLIQRILFPLLQQFYQDTLNYLESDTTRTGGIEFWPRRRLLDIRLHLSVRPPPHSNTDVTTAHVKSTNFRKVGMEHHSAASLYRPIFNFPLLVIVYQ
jgi:hypothetical protein